MEPFSATGIVMGLVGSLMSTCKVLEEVASHCTADWFGSRFRDAVAPLKTHHRELVDVQESLRTNWMHAQLESLSSPLKNIEGHLETLEESIQDMDRYRKIFVSSWQIRGLCGRDIEVARSSTLLAMNMVKMLKFVQRQVQNDRLRIEDVGHTSTGDDEINSRSIIDVSTGPHDLNFFTDDVATIWRINHPLTLVTDPDTMADQILTWVAAPEPQEQFHAHCRAERIVRTCQWFLDTNGFQLWRKRKRATGDRSILWCQGRPGIGKSILASNVIDDIRVSEYVAYFYMSSGRLHSVYNLVASLLKQVCLPFHFVPSRLKHVYAQSKDQPHLLLELDDMLQALNETSRYIQRPITIVVDGLDEINMIERKHFVKFLANLKDSSWNWLFTSRPDQDFMDGALKGCSKASVENHQLVHDIRNFLDGALRGNKALHTMLRDKTLRCDVLETLTSRAQGSFYWASLQIKLILDQTHPSGIRRALQETPSTIRGIFQSAMRLMRQQSKAREQLARRALALVAVVVEPITAGVMCHALGMANVLEFEKGPSELREGDIPNPDSIVECCQGLVAFDPVTSVVKIAYCDIEEYMQKHWDTLFSPDVKIELAEVLLAYLLMDTFLSGLCYHVDDFSRRLKDYPLIVYASHYWGQHVREALSLGMPEQHIIERVNCFLAKRSNLESSLQVSLMTTKFPRVHREMLQSTPEDFAFNADRVKSRSRLHVAVCHRLYWVVRDCIDKSPEMISNQDSFGTSALHEAAGAGSVDFVNMLLTAGAKPLIRDKDGKSPLYHAAKAGHMSIKASLLKHGGSSGASVEREKYDRYDANIFGSHDKLQSLPEAGGQYELSGGRDGSDPSELEVAFCDAAAAGNADVVQQLLDDRENIKLEKYGTKALVLAIQREHEEVLEVLLRGGANPSCPDGSPAIRIPLHQAIRHDHIRIASLLLESGANLKTRDCHNRTALFEALQSLNPNGAALLLYHGANISAIDYLGDTVLHKAVEKGLLGHAQLLINQGIDVNACNKEGMTPLHLAARYGHYHLFRLLLREGANVNAATLRTRETPLMFAVSADSFELCQMLRRRGADVNAISNDKKTSLMLAADAGNVHLVEDLLSNGADPKLSKYEPRESRGPAAEFRHSLIQRLLEE